MEKLFTIVYSFIPMVLGLKGLAKDIFAVIFGFWLQSNRTQTWVSISTMQKITGGSKPAVMEAIRQLEKKNYIKVKREPGKLSLYDVSINETILQEFDATYTNQPVKSLAQQPVRSLTQHQESELTTARKVTYPQKNMNNNRNTSSIIKNGDKINYSGLSEV